SGACSTSRRRCGGPYRRDFSSSCQVEARPDRASSPKRTMRNGQKARTQLPVTPSSGNGFTDLGFLEPEEGLTKGKLASHIRQAIKRRHLTQVAAAALVGVDQPKVSALRNGRLANFSSERLMRFLTALGQDVEIVVKAKPRNRERGRIHVVSELHT